MENSVSFLGRLTNVIRWITRIFSLFVVLIILVFFLGEEVFGNENPGGFNVPVLAVISGILMIGGLLAAWRWEIWGGLISLAGFAWIEWFNPDGRNMPIMYLLFFIPALLFVICGFVQKRYLSEESETKPS